MGFSNKVKLFEVLLIDIGDQVVSNQRLKQILSINKIYWWLKYGVIEILRRKSSKVAD